ncbi:MAG: hypothetical protein ACM3ML_39345 [Micromonosporaceae bacterium]
MTSAPVTRPANAGGEYAPERGHGLIVFASVVLAVVGFFDALCMDGSRENLGG